ncbi:nitrogenase cofactor biosynthesis protein NifB [Methylomonas sp. MED-D]|uniref:FeMo cofactor biosynthesis protein NifB n=1 Tax=Methylomonas koyamae TaxID=702114 RepID=A0A177NB11_9GAMM|nr:MULTISPECIES: nitrogenase cofactor biosynthesis protein NifB [Methylomonas]NJA07698.1 nitrogenase cofactor biosynthesis protein NifB [Methylococcaceae bacterium WWC4]MDT4332531.1 nitrogenase cofactor biosynthesis protein NifB [Methylomonas sp. MV1]OAI15238.1 nitrogenase cofactor biosynthesis protein NifB [Methylomonas koyamae]OHX34655.1 nitrogenase cofactor biosynthesis protein NifB [Methylomonas sp. LWB]WGS85309.1 nitrogenase cofactor biosynthesis protein NifB [Methylomonas sp. UP202]
MELPVLNETPAASAGGCSSHSCGTSDDQLGHLSDEIRSKVENHPCYSEDAHHYFARMHVAVAPACNIQCHYCNRKYDCSNESRPGVVSELLTPEQAVKKTMAVAANIPQMTVLGIAGPGDPLANPERTFETFRRLSAEAPDIKLCVSTNGLALPESVEELSKHNIDHVTITINCVDPEIGAQIYPWIFWENKRIKGVKGAKILIEQQQKGLEMLTARGILVKVNSVMIPGVNDKHLAEVSKIVKAKGAFLHNVMPLIAEAEHGTFYGVMGQRGPTQDELMDLQDSCSGDMNMMRHCRQCRADAVGLLGEDRGDEFTMDKIEAMEIDYQSAMEKRKVIHEAIAEEMHSKRAAKAEKAASHADEPKLNTRPVLMAIATSGQGVINQHFGHAKEFLIYEASPDGVRFMSHRKTDLYCSGDETCGDGESVLQRTIRALEGCEVVLCSKIGYEPWDMLEQAGIVPNGEHAMEPIEDAVMAVYKELAAAGKLDEVKDDQRATA